MGLMSRPTSNPLTWAANQVYVPGDGVLGIYGIKSGVPVGVMVMIGMHLLVGVGDPPSGFSE